MVDFKNYYPQKEATRYVYLKRSFLIFGAIGIAHFLYLLRFSHRDTSPTGLLATEVIFGLALLIWTLTKKIITRIGFDDKNKKLIINYLTLFRNDKKFEILFLNLVYKYNKEPTFRNPKNRVLKIFDKDEKVFSIETIGDGFSQSTIEAVVQELDKIKDSDST